MPRSDLFRPLEGQSFPPLFAEHRQLAENIFAEMASAAQDVAGVSRPAFSSAETAALNRLQAVAQEHGLVVTTDAGQNRLFSLPEDAWASSYVLVGSHVDSVPQGGNYDGLAGVVAGLLCLIQARVSSVRLRRPVKVIALRGEESHWFGPCYIGAKALLGRLGSAELHSRHREDGRTLEEHMQAEGVDTASIAAGRALVENQTIEEYLELHIEQGPLLVEYGLPAAIVSGIRGNLRHRKIVLLGEAGHSGAVPRACRRDPVMALADFLNRLDESWLSIIQKGGDLVVTSGMVSTNPATHSLSRIADRITFSLDCRSQSAALLEELRELIRHEIDRVEIERKVVFSLDEELFTAPAMMDARVVNGLKRAMAASGQKPFVMASGAGHDAAVFANAGIPAGMIFVRNRNGSHNPLEAMAMDDFLAATAILYHSLLDKES